MYSHPFAYRYLVKPKKTHAFVLPLSIFLVSLIPFVIFITKLNHISKNGYHPYTDDTADEEEEPHRDKEISLHVMDVRRTLNGDQIQRVIWKVQDGQLIPAEETHYCSFKSDENYIVLEGNSIDAGRYWQIYNWVGERSSELIFTLPKNNERYQTEVSEYNTYHFGKNHIRVEKHLEIDTRHWSIFYWIGKNSSSVDAGETAYYAVVLHSILKPPFTLRREFEGHESIAFKAAFTHNGMGRIFNQPNALEIVEPKPLLKMLIKGGNLKRIIMKDKNESLNELEDHSKGNVNRNTKKLFLIEGKDLVRFKKVEISAHYTEIEDACLVLESNTVYVYCGKAASEAQKDVAQGLSRMILKRKKSNSQVTIQQSGKEQSRLPAKERQAMENFLQEFEGIPGEKKHEVLRKSQHFDTSATEKIFGETVKTEGEEIRIKLNEDETSVVLEQPFSEKTPISSLKSTNCYLIDTREKDVGVLIWMGKESEIDDRGEYARRAEIYLKGIKEEQPTPVNFVDEERVILQPGATVGDLVDSLKYLLDISPEVQERD